ncbi:hypothetical protein BST81_23820 [Leptolyngbya sp. 'hensonii']|nr:hypothetical protein BST81_23820 [Leptolyngbya sp. 'hensonii']
MSFAPVEVAQNNALSPSNQPPGQPSSSALEVEENPMAQVTSVSQLSDVQPTDWAFQALQSLVERYGCVVGYPDGAYRGSRAMTRYEFAAGLNACMDRINELITAATANLVTKEDLATVQRLQEEFAAELATLRGRVDALEARTATLESQQFSTTTKLNAEVIFHLADTFGSGADRFNETTVSYRARLDFNTSFTGRDRLKIRLQAANFQLFSAGNPTINNTTGGFGAPQRFASTYPNAFSDEARLLASFGPQFQNNNTFRIHFLGYDFPVSDRLNLRVHAGETDPTLLGADPISPFSDFTTGAVSNFANSNPLYYPMGNQAGFGLDYRVTDWLTLAAGYTGQNTAGGAGAPNVPQPTSGFFNGGYTAFSQLTVYTDNLTLGLVYLNSYTPQLGIDTLAGSNAAKVSTGGTFGVASDDRVSANHYGLNVNYRVSKGFQIGGWFGYSTARVLGASTEGVATGRGGDVEVLNFALTLAFPDLGGKGNLGGIVFGVQPKVTSTSNATVAAAIGLPGGQRSDRDTGFHVEAFYTIRLNDNVAITPGVFWLTAPNHDERNPDAVVGVIRTSFTF